MSRGSFLQEHEVTDENEKAIIKTEGPKVWEIDDADVLALLREGERVRRGMAEAEEAHYAAAVRMAEKVSTASLALWSRVRTLTGTGHDVELIASEVDGKVLIHRRDSDEYRAFKAKRRFV
jgi:hypothetical protein